MVNINEVDILLVEDNATDAELTMRALKEKSLANNIIWVKDGAEALDFVFATGDYSERDINNSPKVILLDLRLPKIDGLEVLDKLKSDERTKPIPVVILTSSKEEEDMVKSYRLGVNSYVAKPVVFNDFSKVVTEMGLYWLLVNKMPEK